MPAPKIRADYDALARIAKLFGQHASDASKTYRRIKHQKDVLQNGDWRGLGAKAFFREINSEVLPSIGRLINALELAQHNTRRIYMIWKEAEEEAARLFRPDGRAVPAGTSDGAGAETGASGEGTAQTDAAAEAQAAKDRIKQAANIGKRGMAKLSAVLGGGAAVFGAIGIASIWTGVGGVAGAGGAAVLGILSATAAWMAIDYERVADDPPRDDFQSVTKFEPPEFKLMAPESKQEATWQEFSLLIATQSVAMKALVTSIERYDGVELARKAPEGAGASADDLRSHAALQADAVAHNARACAEYTEGQLDLRVDVNQAWQQLRERVSEASESTAELSAKDFEASYSQVRQDNRALLRDGFNLSDDEIGEIETFLEENKMAKPSLNDLPDVLLDNEWSEAIQTASTGFLRLSDAFVSLKETLQA